MGYYKNINVLLGKTIAKVKQNADKELIFTLETGEKYKMFHEQDCCESVRIEDICGSLDDLVGLPILMAEEATSPKENLDKWGDSGTWTFYKLATNKGYVTIRWYGTSNGYYSETADFVQIK